MINRNLGGAERVIRLLIALALIAWVAVGDALGWTQGIALLAAFALLWNAMFAKCYLWKWLGLNTDCKLPHPTKPSDSCTESRLHEGKNSSGESGA